MNEPFSLEPSPPDPQPFPGRELPPCSKKWTVEHLSGVKLRYECTLDSGHSGDCKDEFPF
jgi:hypothetical protein